MNTKRLGIGDRMKQYYEQVWNFKLPLRMPVIIRLDGKNFHNFTKKMNRPFDGNLIHDMAKTSKLLFEEIQTTVFAYCQSDEISLLLHNYRKLESQALFNNEIQKLVSISAGVASSFMSRIYDKTVILDSRAFVIPETEVANYFIWRQLDATRNSISMLAQSLYSHNELNKKNSKEMQDMIIARGKNWNNLQSYEKRGFCIKGEEIDWNIPIFTQDRKYIEDLLKIESE